MPHAIMPCRDLHAGVNCRLYPTINSIYQLDINVLSQPWLHTRYEYIGYTLLYLQFNRLVNYKVTALVPTAVE